MRFIIVALERFFEIGMLKNSKKGFKIGLAVACCLVLVVALALGVPKLLKTDSIEALPSTPTEPASNEAAEPVDSGDTSIPLNDSQADVPLDFSEAAKKYFDKIDSKYSERSFDTEKHDPCLEWIQKELMKAGYDESNLTVDEFHVGNKIGKNLLLKIEGADPTKQIIVGAHYDGFGATDNGSGIALLLATACGLVNKKPDVNVVCAFFDAEEIGDKMLGSKHYVECMTKEDIANTLFMINIDSIAAGDYCNIYGGVTQGETVVRTEGYELAMNRAEQLGFHVYRTADLDGYYQEHEAGPEVEARAFYTNPWTLEHPTPDRNVEYLSPSTGDWSDHAPFMSIIPYIYFEATNWYVAQYEGECDTDNEEAGINGQIMSTDYDNMIYIEERFPGRVMAHFKLYSPLLSSLMLHPYE